MRAIIIYVILFFRVSFLFSQIICEDIEKLRKEVFENDNDCFLNIITDSLNYEVLRNFNNEIKIGEDILFFEYVAHSNYYLDVFLCSENYIYLSEDIDFYGKVLGHSFMSFLLEKHHGLFKSNNIDSTHYKGMKEFHDSCSNLVLKKYSTFLAWRETASFSKKINLSCNLIVQVLKMKYKFIDFNFYAYTRIPLMYDCEDYKRYDSCVKKIFNIKEPKIEDQVFGVYEKNYKFKLTKHIYLVDILELSIMDEKGNFIKLIKE